MSELNSATGAIASVALAPVLDIDGVREEIVTDEPREQTEFEQEMYDALRAMLPHDAPVEVPPKVFGELQPRFLDYVPGKSMVCTFPVQHRHTNPQGLLLGGILIAAFDAVYGTLGYLVARRPCTSINLDCQFMRPISADDASFTIEVHLSAKTKTMLFMDGRALNDRNKLAAKSTTTMAVIKFPKGSGPE